MTLIEKIFALRAVTPFDRLTHGELAAIAEVARVRTFQAGEKVAASGQVIQRLYAVVGGEIRRDSEEPLPPVFGVRALLYETPLSEDLTAGGWEGATCLLVAKGHFFRIINEFPEFTIGLLASAHQEDFYEGLETHQ